VFFGPSTIRVYCVCFPSAFLSFWPFYKIYIERYCRCHRPDSPLNFLPPGSWPISMTIAPAPYLWFFCSTFLLRLPETWFSRRPHPLPFPFVNRPEELSFYAIPSPEVISDLYARNKFSSRWGATFPNCPSFSSSQFCVCSLSLFGEDFLRPPATFLPNSP